MLSNFEFNAPQFVNFSDVDDVNADKFFDENVQQDQNKPQTFSSKVKEVVKLKESDTENQAPSSTIKCRDPPSSKKNFTVLRKVLHEIVNHQIQSDKIVPKESKDLGKEIIQQFDKLHVSEKHSKKSKGPLKATEVFSGVKTVTSEKKSHPMMTRLDLALQRSASKQSVSSLQSEDSSDYNVSSTTTSKFSKATSVKRNASPLNSARKFISLAEQVEHFYKDTPERFRSKPSVPQKPLMVKTHCIPKTPNLTTKYRQRKVNYPNESEREEMELEEIKKHQIKARPLNEKILMGPSLNLKSSIIKKPVTVPKPFTLTEVKKKELPQEPVFYFKAQPVPTTIFNGPVGIPPKKVAPTTTPTTPHIKVPLRFRVEVKTEEKNTSNDGLNLPRNTVIEPFSFDARMRDLLQKKEEFVKKVIEEEKKSFNSFKAHPMPEFKSRNEFTPKVNKIPHKTVPQPFNLTQTKTNKSFVEDQNLRVTPFKARPASVIHQKPFAPKLQKHETPVASDFHLFTEKRAAERQKFDEKMKQKEEERALILKLQQEEEEKLEKEKMLAERKKAEFKAAPMPRYKVFEIEASNPSKITVPQSPRFVSKTKKAVV